MNKQIRIAIVGIGNCCSSLIQGLFYYKNVKNERDFVPGLMHPILGGYKISENEIDSTLKKVILDFGGKEAIIISKILQNTPNEDLTDERIAELSEVKLNIVRKILYILNENKLTEFQRVRDKRSGWYIYYWTETFSNLTNLLSERKMQLLKN